MKPVMFLALALAGFLTGCSSFNRDWKTVTANPPANKLEGAWEGTWLSDVNHHTGKLRCLVTKQEGNDYQFRFRATFAKVFRYSYTTKFTVQAEGEGFLFKGDEDLGKLAGGLYHYEGTARGNQFDATYQSGYDKGIFQMQRPPPAH